VSPSQSSRCLWQVLSEEIEDVAAVENPDPNFGIQLSHLAQLAVLRRDELLTKCRQLEEQVMFAQVEIGSERARRLSIRAPRKDELHRLVLPPDLVVIENLGKQAL